MSYQFQENISRPRIIDARAWYRAAARQLRNTALDHGCVYVLPEIRSIPSSALPLLTPALRQKVTEYKTDISQSGS